MLPKQNELRKRYPVQQSSQGRYHTHMKPPYPAAGQDKRPAMLDEGKKFW